MIEEAIKRSIEGGFENHLLELRKYIPEDDILQLEGLHDYFFLKPEFWQCLGKGAKLCDNPNYCLEMAEKAHRAAGTTEDPLKSNILLDAEKSYMLEFYFGNWKENWHSFIDHLASGKDAESFFTELLAKGEIL